MTLVIGLTGSIGTGKSTVANLFKELEIPVLDADLVAREVVEPGEVTLSEIEKAFGQAVIQEDGSLNRKALGAIVFADEEKRKMLNHIIHPAIRKRMEEKQAALIQEGVPCLVVDIPLLFENNLFHTVDKVLVVYVDESTQVQRIMGRDNATEEEAKLRMASQISIEEKAKKADAVIDNTGTIEATKEQLYRLLKEWKVLSS